MTLLLRQADLDTLAAEPGWLPGLFDLIEDALVHDAGDDLGYASWLRYPVAAGERRANVMTLSSARHGTWTLLWPQGGRGDVTVTAIGEGGGVEAVLHNPPVLTWRTAAPVAVAARHLAPAGARTLGLIGSGREARLQVRGLQRAVPGLEEVRVWSPTAAHRESFAAELTTQTGLQVRPVAEGPEAVRGADIVSLAAFSPAPPIAAADVRPGALVLAILHNLAPEIGDRRFVPARHTPVIRESGWDPFPHLAGDGTRFSASRESLAEVIAGRTPAREHPDQVVRYEQLNTYAWDSAIYRWTLEEARARSLGEPL